MDRYYWAIII